MLWVISWLIYLSSKIPYISKLISVLSVYYGRTTIWKIISKLRKGFVIFNAIIGMYLVYKTTGFTFDNVLAGFAGLGNTYLEIFVNFNKRLFNWLLELFDYKIIPNVPSNPTKPTGPIWNPNPFNKGWEDKGIDLTKFSNDWFKNPFKVTVEVSPWYKDLSSWLWIGGIICTVGVSYAGYKWMTDPLFLDNIFSYFKGNPTIDNTPPTPPNNGGAGDGGIVLKDLRTKASDFSQKLLGSYKYLTPSYWLHVPSYAQENYEYFMSQQSNVNTYDNKFYPYTEVNPHNSWLKSLRIKILGESPIEMMERVQVKDSLYRKMMSVLDKGKGVEKWKNNLDSVQSLDLHDSESPLVRIAGVSPNLENLILPSDSASQVSEIISESSLNIPSNSVYDINLYNQEFLYESLNNVSNYINNSYIIDGVTHTVLVIGDKILTVDPNIVINPFIC
jgi:hypothetical protein